MQLQLLREISWKTLPLTLQEPEDIDEARGLRACGYAAVLFSAPGSTRPFARVLAVTRQGQEALRSAAENDGRGQRSSRSGAASAQVSH
jgi:hypothetical protein